MKLKKLFSLSLIFILVFLVGCTTDSIEPPVERIDFDIEISVEKDTFYVGDNIIVDVTTSDPNCFNNVYLEIVSEINNATIIKNVISPNSSGSFIVVAKLEGYDYIESNELVINVEPSIYDSDPYEGLSKDEFYENYFEAINYQDALYRTLHGFMSGGLELPNEAPTIADYQPKEDEAFIRNTNAYYSVDKDAYFITDAYGEIVDMVFDNGGYISLDEVASHLLAFGKVPGNYNPKKSARPSESIWKEYLRVNDTAFSGSTTKYPYEPKLPRISGCGGDLYYYEVDFGTTGTTCDPSYDILPYNNGSKITRGAARLVYTKFDANRNNIIDINEKYVFYTYNHYNDFQEYLNYQGGWGEMFGNITGGGSLSSKTDYNPTDYVEVIRKDFSSKGALEESKDAKEVYYLPKKEEYLFY